MRFLQSVSSAADTVEVHVVNNGEVSALEPDEIASYVPVD